MVDPVKKARTFRDFVLVMPATAKPTMHSAHGNPRQRVEANPYTSWSWCGPGGDLHEGFRRLSDAKADVERVHGKTDWKPYVGAMWRGDYGPHYTADEWLRRSQPGTEEACGTPESTK